MDLRFTLLFFLLIAVVAFITRRMMNRYDNSAAVEEIVSEIIPLLNDPTALGRKYARDLRNRRILGSGTIFDISTTSKAQIIRVRERIAVETDGMTTERDVVFDLSFMHPDTLDDAAPGRYVEFTGILTGVTGRAGTPLLAVDPGEILFIGDRPTDDDDGGQEDGPGQTGRFE